MSTPAPQATERGNVIAFPGKYRSPAHRARAAHRARVRRARDPLYVSLSFDRYEREWCLTAVAEGGSFFFFRTRREALLAAAEMAEAQAVMFSIDEDEDEESF